MNEPVRVVDYDPRWPLLFAEERARIVGAIGSFILDIQHVGATSVSGCGGKPIIDIMIAVRDLAVVEKCIQPLESLGYEFRGEAGIPGRLFFGKRDPETAQRTHHLHMVEQDSDFWRDLLLFRDYLRAHPEEAGQYSELKKKLAAEFGTDREGYTEAKSPFIQSVLAKARAARAPF